MSIATRGMIGVLACWAACAQDVSKLPEFEVASIKPGAASADGGRLVGCQGGPGTPDPGLFHCTNMDLANLVTMGFALRSYQLANGNYADPAFYNITAKVPPGATRDQLNLMIRRLVIERFKLTYHYEKREV